ncbi:MAG: hypothetical protein JWQ09_1989, partial [Segetibacter sp.]|nr:hypothetical protein [Segetibacter sp.]
GVRVDNGWGCSHSRLHEMKGKKKIDKTKYDVIRLFIFLLFWAFYKS